MDLSWNSNTNLIKEYFKSLGWIRPDEEIIEFNKAGEGNMNFVARVITQNRQFIVKQARNYVEKYPQISAPKERLYVEKEYYKTIICNVFLSELSPKIIGYDPFFNTMAMEDLGFGSDFLGIYHGRSEVTIENIRTFMQYLSELHSIQMDKFPENTAMKMLNHEHIFNYPFLENNGLDLDSIQDGLQEISLLYKNNVILKSVIEQLGQRYLRKGNILVHGDFYPGSWLNVSSGIKIIDPEFSFLGDAEFDLGVMLAHFDMALIQFDTHEILNYYSSKHKLAFKLLQQYRGVEIMRRILGLAQLPLNLDIEQKKDLLQKAFNLIMS